MKKRIISIILALSIAFGGVLAISGCSKSSGRKSRNNKKSERNKDDDEDDDDKEDEEVEESKKDEGSTETVGIIQNIQSGSIVLTEEEQEAYDVAVSYMKYIYMSRTQLIGQLEYEGYSNEVAEKVVAVYEAQNSVDWEEIAILWAEDFISDVPMSRGGLISIMTSDIINFSSKQAEVAVSYLEDNNLVDWNEQAVLVGEEMLSYREYERQDFIQDMTSEWGKQFTREQAEYAADELGIK